MLGALNNLIDNSLYWLRVRWPDRPPDIESSKRRLFLGASRDLAEGPAIVVADNGAGFQDTPEHVTRPFFTRKPGGMGLGLYYANLAMELNGGRLAFPHTRGSRRARVVRRRRGRHVLQGIRMMLGSPRIIAIDDQPDHLQGLADCLNQQGIACLRIHFTGDPADVQVCPDVRIIFADLHLGMGSPSDHKSNFSMIGGLLRDTIKPSGPYFIILWTQFPEQAEALRTFLDRPDTDVAKPFDVQPLAKADHLDPHGRVKDEEVLIEAIKGIVGDSPQLASLFDWEGWVLAATGRTVSSILDLAAAEGTAERAKEVGKILSRLAIEAVGANNVETDPFRAVNEALLPILADRMSALRSGVPQQEIWSKALEPVAGLPGAFA